MTNSRKILPKTGKYWMVAISVLVIGENFNQFIELCPLLSIVHSKSQADRRMPAARK